MVGKHDNSYASCDCPHATRRNIDANIFDYLLSFGQERLTNKGASIVYSDKQTKNGYLQSEI